MTYVASSFNFSPNSNRSLKYYTVEIVTFDGESFTEEVEALSIGDDYLTARIGMSLSPEYRSTALWRSMCVMKIFRSHHF